MHAVVLQQQLLYSLQSLPIVLPAQAHLATMIVRMPTLQQYYG
jgi:hypothetical protein